MLMISLHIQPITYLKVIQLIVCVRNYLPKNVNEDLSIKVWLNGKLDEEQSSVVNPGLTSDDLYPMTFEGTGGKSELVITLNGQEYVAFELDFDKEVATELWSKEYIPATSSEPEEEESTESSWLDFLRP